MNRFTFLIIVTISILITPVSFAKNGNNSNQEKFNKINNYIKVYLSKYPEYFEYKEKRKIFDADLNNDGLIDVVAQFYLDEKDGGTGTAFTEVAIFVNKNGKYLYICSIPEEGGSNGFNIKKIKSQVILIEVKEYDDDDAMCCPSIVKYIKYRLKDNKIQKIK